MEQKYMLRSVLLRGLLGLFLLSSQWSLGQFFSSPPNFQDGNIDSGYAIGSEGWAMGWDNTYLYIRKNTDNNQPVIVYIDADPIIPSSGGNNSNGNLTGVTHWGITPILPFRADFSMYWEDDFLGYRVKDGSGSWSTETSISSSERTVNNQNKECRIPWTTITGGGGRPNSFNWLGYCNSRQNPTGFIFHNEPNNSLNPTGFISSPRDYSYYSVVNTSNTNTTNPFSLVSFETRDNFTYTSSFPNNMYDFNITSGNLTIDNSLNIGVINFNVSEGSLSGTGSIRVNEVMNKTTSGTFDTNGKLILNSNASNTARVAQVTGTILGNVTTERYLPANRAWRLLTAPMKGNSNNTIQDNWQGTNGEGVLLWGPSGTGLATGPQNNIYSFNNGAWTPVTNTTTTNLFDTDKNNAFMVFAVGPHGGTNISSDFMAAETTLRPKGSLITGNVSYTGLNTNTFHLIANPYASPISTSALKTTNPDFNFWLLDPSLGTVGGYYTFDGSNWTPSTPVGDAVNIQSGQGFFVRSASSNSFTINESHKAVGNSNAWFARQIAQNNNENKIRVLLHKQVNSQWQLLDGILSVSGNNYANEVDAQDALKVSNFNENIMFRNGSSNLAIEYQNLPTAATEQPIRLTGTTATSYRLTAKTEGFVSVNLQPILQDTQSGTNYLIPTDGSTIEIPFTGVVSTTNNPDNRFKIVYQQVLGIEQPIANTLQVYPNPVTDGQFSLILPNTTIVATYEITNYLGQVVQKGELAPSNTKVSVAHQPTGIYLVKVQQNGLVYTTKIIKK
jgi:hypothetical protein